MPATGGTSQKDRAVELLEKRGALRRIELGRGGVHPETLARLVDEGILTRVARGLYQLADADISAPHDLAEVAKLVPRGVIVPCLRSPVPRTRAPDAGPGLARHRREGAKAQDRIPSGPGGADGTPGAFARRGNPHRRRGIGSRLRPGQDGGRLFSLQKACRFRRRARGPSQRHKVGQGQTGGDRSIRPRNTHLVGAETLSRNGRRRWRDPGKPSQARPRPGRRVFDGRKDARTPGPVNDVAPRP